MNTLTAPQKQQLNALVRAGCRVLAAHHDDVVRVTVRYRGSLLADITGATFDTVFDEACEGAHAQLFGHAAVPAQA